MLTLTGSEKTVSGVNKNLPNFSSANTFKQFNYSVLLQHFLFDENTFVPYNWD